MLKLDRALNDAGQGAPGGGPSVLDLKAFLQGAWQLTRTLEDRRAGQRGRLDGQAVFAPAGAGLVYRERGVLRLGAFTGPAERVYRYGFPAPERAEVAFEDGHRFHDLDLSHGRWSVVHSCRDDLYRGSFEVEGRDRWTVVWRVVGPRKDQVLRGRYDRADNINDLWYEPGADLFCRPPPANVLRRRGLRDGAIQDDLSRSG